MNFPCHLLVLRIALCSSGAPNTIGVLLNTKKEKKKKQKEKNIVHLTKRSLTQLYFNAFQILFFNHITIF